MASKEKNEQRIQELLKEWEKVALCTDPANWDEADEGLREVYRLSGNPLPAAIKHCRSPYEGIIAAWCCMELSTAEGVKFTGTKTEQYEKTMKYVLETDFSAVTLDREKAKKVAYQNGFGSLDAGWISYHLYELETTGKCSVPTLAGIEKIARNAGWWWSFDGMGIICDRTSALKINASIQLHCDDSPAIAYRCGKKDYFLNGIKVNEQIVERPHTLTGEQIVAENNQEIRRIMIERLGADKFILSLGCKPVHKDEFGELFKAPLKDDEDICVVKVINSTPEPDGEYKTYFLRVPPTMERAKQAIAWTFGMTEDEYAPAIET